MRIAACVPRLLAGGLLVGALLMAGCGGSDSPALSLETGTTEPSAVAAPNTTAVQTDAKAPAAAADQPRRGQVDPCALLTEERVAAAANEPMLQGERGTHAPPLGQQICTWNAAAQGSSRIVLVSVVRTQDMDEALRKQKYNAAELFRGSKDVGGPAEQVSGVGDEAVRIQNEIRAVKGDVYLVVHVGGGPIGTRNAPVPTETLKDLAQAAFAKLGA